MNRFSSILFAALLLITSCTTSTSNSKGPAVIPTFDVENPQPMPNHFRSTNDAVGFGENGSLIHLHMSGSAEFTASNFPNLLSKIPMRNVTIVDLREESHGFINGTPIGWVSKEKNIFPNEGKSAEEIGQDEAQRLVEASEKGMLTVFLHKVPKNLTVFNTSTEKNLVESFGANYFRIPVTDEHKPSPHEVDRFVAFVKNLPENTWLHFHCRMGKGRTTTFMILYDIMRNGNKLSLEAIIHRQHELGGADLFDMPDSEKPKYQWAVDRLNFLKQFYEYSKESNGFSTQFSEWLKTKSKNAPAAPAKSLSCILTGLQ